MNPKRFRLIVSSIRKSDPRFAPEAYVFLLRALDFTVEKNQQDDSNESGVTHTNCRDLLEGFCEFGLQEMGPMAAVVFREWGITDSVHVGEIVFHLIEAGVLQKQDSDKLDDFRGYPLADILDSPYRPLAPLST